MATKIISGLENVEQKLDGKEIRFLHVDVNEVSEISVSSVPSLVYFKNGEPFTYNANLMNEESIRSWAEEEFRTNQDVIEDLNGQQVKDLIKTEEYVLIFACNASSNVHYSQSHLNRHFC